MSNLSCVIGSFSYNALTLEILSILSKIPNYPFQL